MVEFKVDPRDGIPKLMEVNPRFWGSLQLAIVSGVDFPYLILKMARRESFEPILHYACGKALPLASLRRHSPFFQQSSTFSSSSLLFPFL